MGTTYRTDTPGQWRWLNIDGRPVRIYEADAAECIAAEMRAMGYEANGDEQAPDPYTIPHGQDGHRCSDYQACLEMARLAGENGRKGIGHFNDECPAILGEPCRGAHIRRD